MTGYEEFLGARDFLLDHREEYAAAVEGFGWPQPDEFNWALNHFDTIERDARALWLVHEDGSEERFTFGELTALSNRMANLLHGLGVERGDRLLLMLGNITPLWVTMLAATKIGAVLIPSSTLLGPEELTDRLDRGAVRVVVTSSGLTTSLTDLPPVDIRIAVGPPVEGWTSYDDAIAGQAADFTPDRPTPASDPLFLYFTSGTTSKPKLVEHSHASYPIGHLSTMFWMGVQPGDVHLNVSSPGWGKHAWSNFFGPWNAGATVFMVNQARFDAAGLLDAIARAGVTTFCAPPTVWRMLVQQDLGSYDVALREVIGAGEPLNAEIIDQVRAAWGLTIRDGFGQTETTAVVGNSPGQPVKDGSMGRPLPGYDVVLLDPDGNPAQEGEICLTLEPRPLGLMSGYRDSAERTAQAMAGGYYRTGDVASRDEDGYITYVGRADDVFKASDYRISPFELESVLIEHAAVAEAAVVPSPDALRLAVPKAFVVLVAGRQPDAETARDILDYCRGRLAPFKRIRRIEFAELPKTISGKIRRVELRGTEGSRDLSEGRRTGEFWEEDLSPDPNS
ncbi:MAG: AMP-binding protein [Geodermatophilaceae bacterium]|nr:AMP-binding protein [Geodermatophilaceae bacterium]